MMKAYLGLREGIMREHNVERKDHKVFDWDMCATLIREHCMVNDHFDKDVLVQAGLAEDWGFTSAVIFENGKIVERADEPECIYLASSWATPILDIDGVEFPCWKKRADTHYDAKTYWPKEAKKILLRGIKREK